MKANSKWGEVGIAKLTCFVSNTSSNKQLRFEMLQVQTLQKKQSGNSYKWNHNPTLVGSKLPEGEKEYTQYNFLQAFDHPPFTAMSPVLQ
jgi:hypothetical protein